MHSILFFKIDVTGCWIGHKRVVSSDYLCNRFVQRTSRIISMFVVDEVICRTEEVLLKGSAHSPHSSANPFLKIVLAHSYASTALDIRGKLSSLEMTSPCPPKRLK